MRYGSVCSGIEAATVAWHSLGWTPVWFSEIEKFPSAVLEHHYPHVPNLGDMTKLTAMIESGEIQAPDVLVGGTPCQAFSMAGLRNSLDDNRGQLTLEFVRLANAIDTVRRKFGKQPCVIVWENVPGVLNTKDNAFGCFLAGLAGERIALESPRKRWTNAGYVLGPSRQVGWRVLDAQFFGLAQRRKRVFVVASARTECIAQILFERKSMQRNTDTCEEKGQDFTSGSLPGTESTGASTTLSGKTIFPTLLAAAAKGWNGNQEAFCGDYHIKHTVLSPRNMNLDCTCEVVSNLAAGDRNQPKVVFGIQGNTIGRSDKSGGNGIGFKEEQAPTLTTADRHGVAIHGTQDPIISEKAHCLGRNSGQENVFVQSIARYLTEIECERLQGFPDNYTNIPNATKGHRYKALGNSMAVPVMRWIGERINGAML